MDQSEQHIVRMKPAESPRLILQAQVIDPKSVLMSDRKAAETELLAGGIAMKMKKTPDRRERMDRSKLESILFEAFRRNERLSSCNRLLSSLPRFSLRF